MKSVEYLVGISRLLSNDSDPCPELVYGDRRVNNRMEISYVRVINYIEISDAFRMDNLLNTAEHPSSKVFPRASILKGISQ